MSIPSIITTGPPALDQDDSLSPSTPTFLSPSPTYYSHPPRISLEVPPSPAPTYASSNDGSTIPPSPTLSHQSSIQFATSLNLRENDVNKPLSPGLLSPDDHTGFRSHHRKPSWASSIAGSSSDGTEPDISFKMGVPLQHVKTTSTDITRVDRSRSHSRGKSLTRESNRTSFDLKGKGRERSEIPEHLLDDLPQDLNLDPSPFKFKPYQLAQMFDPKDLNLLQSLCGVEGLLLGLGTDRTRGVGNTSLKHSSSPGPGSAGEKDGQPVAGNGTSQRHNRQEEVETPQSPLPGIVVTAPEGNKEDKEDTADTQSLVVGGPAFSAPLEERRRVYGRNDLPQRAGKSLISLMLATLKDKVLVLIFCFFLTSFESDN